MKKQIIAAALLFTGSFVHAEAVVYKGTCLVHTYQTDGSDFKQLAQVKVELGLGQKVELLRSATVVYTVSTSKITDGDPYEIFLDMTDLNTGRRIASGSADWYATGPVPPAVRVYSDQAEPNGLATDIQCVQ